LQLSDHVYIPDGYTKRGYVAAIEGLHGAVDFTYRPVQFEQFIAHRDAYLAPANPKTRHMVPPASLNEYVKTWDVTDPNSGAEVPIAAKSFARLPPPVMEKMFWIVLGTQPSDPRPDELPNAEDESLAADAQTQRRYLAELEQERDAKNSSAVSSHS
jgi:hypothetical protein